VDAGAKEPRHSFVVLLRLAVRGHRRGEATSSRIAIDVLLIYHSLGEPESYRALPSLEMAILLLLGKRGFGM
jgi:hypothetical protein